MESEELPTTTGRVAHILRDRGYGFIKCIEGEHVGRDLFFHTSGLNGISLDDLQEGEIVTFEIRTVPKGLRAERIRRVA